MRQVDLLEHGIPLRRKRHGRQNQRRYEQQTCPGSDGQASVSLWNGGLC
jgi:hypothetical protein